MKFENVLASKTAWKVLNILLSRPWDEFYFRSLVKEAKASPNIVHRTLKLLEKEQMLVSRKVGNTVTYKINSNSSTAHKLLLLHHDNRLRGLPKEFMVHVNRLMRKLPKNVRSVILYGSVAGGKATAYSDIDIAVVHEGRIDQNKIRIIFSEYSRYVQVIYFTPEHFNELYAEGSEFIRSLIKGGIIVHDNEFFCKYVFMPLPKPSKKYIEELLEMVKVEIEHLWELYRKNTLPFSEMVYPTMRKLSIALLLLNKQIPESKHDTMEKLKKISEKRLSGYLSKTKKIWDGGGEEFNKNEIENILKLSENKLSECYAKLEEYDG